MEADRLAVREVRNRRMLGCKGPAQPSPALGDARIRSTGFHTSPNVVVAPIHPKAMPVILTNEA